MTKNRIAAIIFIIASTVFVSFYGGKFAYILFYISLLIPVSSFLYTVIVFLRFKLNQNIEKRTVLKGERTPYEFVISNEGFISYVNIKVNFFDDKSHIEDNGELPEYSLLPQQKAVLNSSLSCKYRGEYEVGVKSVVISDYFYLFKITYPILTKLNLTVFPRVVELEHLGFDEEHRDNKDVSYNLPSEEQFLDTEVRKYEAGDNKKLIHWKLSARKHELLTRKYYSIPKTKIFMAVDFSQINQKALSRIITEDKIIETALAVSNYYCKNKINISVNYAQAELQFSELKDEADFKEFYKKCCYIHFESAYDINEIVNKSLSFENHCTQMIIITHKLSQELYFSLAKAQGEGINIVLLYINEHETDLIKAVKECGAAFYQIYSEDNIAEIF